MKRSLTLVAVLGAILCGCGGKESPTFDSGTGVDALRSDLCAKLAAETTTWNANHLSCNVDDDCIGVPAYGFMYDGGSDLTCWPATVIAKDGRDGLIAQLDKMAAAMCHGPPSGICSAWFPNAVCRDHVCKIQ